MAKKNGYAKVFSVKEDGRMRLAKNLITDEQGHVLHISNQRSAQQYLDQFFFQKEGKIVKYVTQSGFTSAGYVRRLGSQGLLKATLAAIAELNERAIQGDREAQEALRVMEEFKPRQKKLARASVLARLREQARMVA